MKLASLNIEYQHPTQDEVEKSMSSIINTCNVRKVYEFQKLLGHGSFGIVHKAIDQKFNQ
jgi:serine/threonine protein kinase